MDAKKKKHENKGNLDFALIIARIVPSTFECNYLIGPRLYPRSPYERHKVVVTEKKKEHAPLYRRKIAALSAYDKYTKKKQSQEHRSIPATFASSGACKSFPTKTYAAALVPHNILYSLS